MANLARAGLLAIALATAGAHADAAAPTEVERACALSGYPKMLTSGIHYSVGSTKGTWIYELLAPAVVEGGKFRFLTLHVMDGGSELAAARLEVEVDGLHRSPRAAGRLRAWFTSQSRELMFRIDADYGFPCTVTIEQTIGPDSVE